MFHGHCTSKNRLIVTIPVYLKVSPYPQLSRYVMHKEIGGGTNNVLLLVQCDPF